MNIPTFLNTPITKEDGQLTDTWKLFFGQLTGQMQNALSDEGGYQIPHLSADQLALKTDTPNGTHFYDTTNGTPVVKKNGTFVPYP